MAVNGIERSVYPVSVSKIRIGAKGEEMK